MNSAFLRFRLRQFKKFIFEIPVIYLIILTGIALIAGIALYEFTKELKGSLIGISMVLHGVFFGYVQLTESIKSIHAISKEHACFC